MSAATKSAETKQEERIKSQQAYVLGELKKLEGGKIVAIGAVVDEEFADDFGWPEVWPVLHVLLPNGTKLEVSVSQDEEGNGPGHLFIGAI